jgi:hypothetical protein
MFIFMIFVSKIVIKRIRTSASSVAKSSFLSTAKYVCSNAVNSRNKEHYNESALYCVALIGLCMTVELPFLYTVVS